MHTYAFKVSEKTDGVQRFFPPFGMDGILRQLLGRTDLHPVTLTCDLVARFILMQHVFCLAHCCFDLLIHWSNWLAQRSTSPCKVPTLIEGLVPFLDHFTGALDRHILPQGILHWRSHVLREGRAALLVSLKSSTTSTRLGGRSMTWRRSTHELRNEMWKA